MRATAPTSRFRWIVEADRHVLPPRPVGDGPALGELPRRAGLAVDVGLVPDVVVRGLVVVPDDGPRGGPVGGLQVLVAPVEGVELSVVVEGLGHDLPPAHGALGPASGASLVDVVPQAHDEVDAGLGQVAVGGVVAVAPLGAGHLTQPEAVGRRARLGHGDRPADRALVVADQEAVEELLAGLQAGGVDVHGVGGVGPGHRGPVADQAAEALVGRQLPPHRHVLGRHAAPGGERVRGQAGPEHDGVGGRVARRHAEREGVARQAGDRERAG
jgi:hypothetical protein